MRRWIHSFDKKIEDVVSDRRLVGNKGLNLCLMKQMGLPVPSGFVITSEAFDYREKNKALPKEFFDELKDNLSNIEKALNLKFGDPNNPLILSIRSGSQYSMPGMLDTILNIGLNKKVVDKISQNDQSIFALDTWRRFLQMYSHVVFKIEHYFFDEILESYLLGAGLSSTSQLDAEDFEEICAQYLSLIEEKNEKPFSENVNDQLVNGIYAVMDSWKNERAVAFRKLNNIPDEAGIAVNIQKMVFGNLNEKSASGVLFSRNPDNGEKVVKGEYILCSQGEDVVSGFFTPQSINKKYKNEYSDSDTLEEKFPSIYEELLNISIKLENYFRNVQDIEFTIESGNLWILQSRNAETNLEASLNITRDMVKEGLIEKKHAIASTDPDTIKRSLTPILDDSFNNLILSSGLPASPGVISGKIAFDSEGIDRIQGQGGKSILVLVATNTKDIKAMHNTDGILTSHGGLTSHAAVVARGLGKTCITGAREIIVDVEERKVIINEEIFHEDDILTINGHTGDIIKGVARTKSQDPPDALKDILGWCEEIVEDKHDDPITLLEKAKAIIKN
jgi:pyruvate,orthophosphate dikinase|tara:strand:+ start:3314 stop:4999 length:1686 start_codon:yes stop_codon:yes gene_type:complete